MNADGLLTWTVTIAGSERYDGEAPYLYVLYAADGLAARAAALRHHQREQEDNDLIILDTKPGLPEPNWNDLR